MATIGVLVLVLNAFVSKNLDWLNALRALRCAVHAVLSPLPAPMPACRGWLCFTLGLIPWTL